MQRERDLGRLSSNVMSPLNPQGSGNHSEEEAAEYKKQRDEAYQKNLRIFKIKEKKTKHRLRPHAQGLHK